MTTIVGVRFKRTCKIYYFDPADTGAVKGDDVIVETTWGMEFGTVTVGPKEVDDKHVTQPLKPIIRKVTDADRKKLKENSVREKEAFNICQRCIRRHGLEMSLVDVEFTFDVSRIIFYFTADGRIDFRELVKDLASVFRTRIELRQIGVRDEARMVGGIGCCGRLMCCLKFEDYLYEEPKGKNKKPRREKAEMPQVGTMVATSMGNGKVTTVNKAKHTATVQLTPDNVVTLEWDEIMEADKAVQSSD